jgi:hypothetical protein
MDNTTFVMKINFNRIALDAWIDERRRPDGDYDLIGMGRRTEYNAKTGAVVSDKTEPTGITGWAPREAIEGPRPSWWRRLFGAA